MAHEVEFVVEEAGCTSCAARLRDAFEAIGSVVAIDIDEAADTARVHLHASNGVSSDIVDRELERAAAGSGHAYRRKAGTWLVQL